jgi:hypothetical protein
MRRVLYRTLLTGILLWPATISVRADEPSPIFGSAKIEKTTEAQNKGIIGKGYYGQYYGYYGQLYAYYAYYYGYYGYQYGSYDYYLSAYYYATAAASNLYNAQYYTYYGL